MQMGPIRLSCNIGKKLPFCFCINSKHMHIEITLWRKPEIVEKDLYLPLKFSVTYFSCIIHAEY